MTLLLLGVLLAAPDCQSDPDAAGCALWVRATATTVNREKVEEIYLRPEFSRARLRNQGTVEQLLRRLRVWFESFFESRGAESYSQISRFLVLLAAAFAAGWAVLRVLSRRRSQRPARPGQGQASAAVALESPLAHLSRARAQLGVDPRAAIREGLLGLLSILELRRWARPDRVKTNRELARELPSRGAHPELTARVEALLDWYDRAFYSLADVAQADASRFLDDVERLSGA